MVRSLIELFGYTVIVNEHEGCRVFESFLVGKQMWPSVINLRRTLGKAADKRIDRGSQH